MTKKPVKRKIDFEKVKAKQEMVGHEEENIELSSQQNNNATVSNVQNFAQTRSRSRSKEENFAPCSETTGHVQWTQEFLDKVRKSNAKHKEIVAKKKQKLQKCQESNKSIALFQESANGEQTEHTSQRKSGDGIQMVVDKQIVVEDNEDLLDYNDDLSIDDEADFMVDNSMVEVDVSPAGGDKNSSEGETSQAKNSATKPLSDLIEGRSEEELMQNPVIQRMMQKFCWDEFKNLQKEQECASQKDRGKSKLEQTMIKSPSDTKIYAPALQKRLTPNNEQIGHKISQVPRSTTIILCYESE